MNKKKIRSGIVKKSTQTQTTQPDRLKQVLLICLLASVFTNFLLTFFVINELKNLATASEARSEKVQISDFCFVDTPQGRIYGVNHNKIVEPCLPLNTSEAQP